MEVYTIMASRLELHQKLVSILGSNYVYFQAPTNRILHYPCIKYSEDRRDFRYADNTKFLKNKAYTVTIIDEDPESEIPDLLEQLPYCSHNRTYSAEGLYHFVYRLFY